ncbi:hypothetical protein A9Q84_00725 [Halobacteriovorax marinus]|uniref:Secreted protein n=1 Tax=Halobacteriovorax marinus TaxID=97084 RepID=A0A1Y5FI94_9BACT|nr:hypothetical protein A9Q84_00725 [Halobacteriovorax marinus]
MKLAKIALVAFTVLGSSAMAATSYDVCNKIQSINSSNGARCVSIISRGAYISDEAAGVCLVAANSSTSSALKCLQAAVDKSIQPSAAKVCKKVASINSNNVQSCMSAIGDATYSGGITKSCLTTANSSTSQAVKCLQTAKNSYIQDSAVKVCTKVASINTNNVVSCVSALKDKEFYNGVENICLSTANSSTSDAVKCLQNAGVNYYGGGQGNPDDGDVGNPGMTVTVSVKKIKRLEKALERALDNLEFGSLETAAKQLARAMKILQKIQN